MNPDNIHILDLDFQGTPGVIAAYLIPYSGGAVLVECGPGSTLKTLQHQIKSLGYEFEQVTDVLVTHIHLDHAGSAGWWARQGARIHVHPVGAPHLVRPKRLLASAGKIYGDQMGPLWGNFIPVRKERIEIHQDGDKIQIGELAFTAIDTPGHAYHHFVYLLDGICFSGDIAGVRLRGSDHIRIPMPPPEFRLDLWVESVKKIKNLDFDFLALTHFGIYPEVVLHLKWLLLVLQEADKWINNTMPLTLSTEVLQERTNSWIKQQVILHELPDSLLDAYEIVTPTWMTVKGIQHYWKKLASSLVDNSMTKKNNI